MIKCYFQAAFVDCRQIGLQSRFMLTKIQCITQKSHDARMTQDACLELNLSERCLRNNKILSYRINRNAKEKSAFLDFLV